MDRVKAGVAGNFGVLRTVAVLILGAALLVVFVLGYIYGWEWVGVVRYEYEQNNVGITRTFVGTVTLWDWFSLLIVPLILAATAAGLTAWFSHQRAEVEREIADERQRQEYLERYFNKMEELLLGGLLNSENSAARTIAKTRTLDVLSLLDSARKTQVLLFLHRAELINRPLGDNDDSNPVVDLTYADLISVELEHASMTLANLAATILYGANMRHSWFQGVVLSRAYLQESDLSHASFGMAGHVSTDRTLYADLSGADLRNTTLNYTIFRGAEMSRTKLRNADTQGAYFDGAAFSRETEITVAQLQAASSCEYAFSWNDRVLNDIFPEMWSGSFDVSSYPLSLAGGNWSLSERLGRYARRDMSNGKHDQGSEEA